MSLHSIVKKTKNLKKLRQKLRVGASVEEKDEQGRTLLQIACIRSKLLTVMELLKLGADINAVDVNEQSALHLILKCKNFNEKHINIMNLLLKNGISVTKKNSNGRDPLNLAILNKRNETIIESILKHGANVNGQDFKGMTPLHYAIGHNQDINVINKLLDYGASVVVTNNAGETVLRLALLKKRNVILIKKLLEMGSCVHNAIIQYSDNRDEYDLHDISTDIACDIDNDSEPDLHDISSDDVSDDDRIVMFKLSAAGIKLQSVFPNSNGTVINTGSVLSSFNNIESDVIFSKPVLNFIESSSGQNVLLLKYALLEHTCPQLKCKICEQINVETSLVEEFLAEIRLMRTTRILHEISLYDTIHNGDYGIIVHNNHDYLLENRDIFFEIFPHFHAIILEKLETKLYLQKRLLNLNINLHVFPINEYCLSRICSFLSKVDLKHLIEIYETHVVDISIIL